ncbi:MAG: DUF541 domain-containing protein [Rhodobacteraceae bacterium]|nr:MAG: DUF541 domain-containing protein [Paracoccaceae bacterium]
MLRGLIVNVFVICLWVIPAAAQESPGRGHVVVTGTGQVQASPDIATVTLGVAHEAREAREAMNRVSADVAKLFERLTALGVEPRDVQTTTLRLDPVWRDDSRTTPREGPSMVGFVARNELTIRLRDMDRLGAALEVLLEDGANRFSGISFGVTDPAPLLDEARKLAVGDARRKAEIYAGAAGVTLGDVLEISEPGSAPSPMASYARAEAVSSDMPVAGGELNFDAQVTIVYALTR